MPIEYARDLNPSQYEAVTLGEGPALVIAGAGSGKTRTIVYRLAYLTEQGVSPESIVLLTFTRRAAQEMLHRAGRLLDASMAQVAGGTFHGFAYSVLRRHGHLIGLARNFTLLDRGDAENLLKQLRDDQGIAKTDRSFPKKSTVLDMVSKSRNKEVPLEVLLAREAPHLLAHADDMERLAGAYTRFKLEHGLADYDDLLFHCETLLADNDDLAALYHAVYRAVLVDEFQDTNLVQGRLVELLAGERRNVMVVGDDAQSIYAFRGADVRNILDFPSRFPGTRVITLEENYRSTQPILDLTNAILAGSAEKYEKHLFTSRRDGDAPQLVRAVSDASQAQLVLDRVLELSRTYPLHEIAVLFRAGYQSFQLEVNLTRLGVPFQKFGGMRFTEAAHVKDMLAYLRLIRNPSDLPAWQRALDPVKGVGPTTAGKIMSALLNSDAKSVEAFCKRYPDLRDVLDMLDAQRNRSAPPAGVVGAVLAFYTPVLEARYPDDFPKRLPGLEQMVHIAAAYESLDTFLADLSLESPDASGRGAPQQDALVLSTVHSAKGLEWSAVIIIDLVEDRFPSRHALQSGDEYEEERRLLYVACTRAKDMLVLCAPDTVYNRYQDRREPALTSPFIAELPAYLYQEWRERLSGGLDRSRPRPAPTGTASPAAPPRTGDCFHKIFGRGRIVQHIPPDKYKVNFPGFGLKVIIADYLAFDEHTP